MNMRCWLVVAALVAVSRAEVGPGDAVEGVVDFHHENFQTLLAEDKDILLEFYAPWCGWCKRIAPMYADLGGVVAKSGAPLIIGKIDCTHPEAGPIKDKYQVKGFPTIVLLKKGQRDSPVKFQGERTVAQFLKFLHEHTGVNVAEDGSAFKLGGSEGGAADEAPAAEEAKPAAVHIDVKAGEGVIDLTPENFDAVVLSAEHDVFVKFYAPWCGHCQRMEPAWHELGITEKQAVVARLDASNYRDLATKYQVRGFPTLKLFKKSDKQNPVPYQGARDFAAMAQFIETNRS